MARGRGTRNPNAAESDLEEGVGLGDGAEVGGTNGSEGEGMSETETDGQEPEIGNADTSGVQIETVVRVTARDLSALADHFAAKAAKAHRVANNTPARGVKGAKRKEAEIEAALYGEVAGLLRNVTFTG